MLAKKKHERGFKQLTNLSDGRSREIIERQLAAFRATLGREPAANDPIKQAIRFIEKNYDNDAIFECPHCETQTIAWAIAHLACPDCGHDPMHRGMVIAK
jgi:hypothetical protein